MSMGMLRGKVPKGGTGGAGWVKSRSNISANQAVIALMSAMWSALWGYVPALTRAMQ